MLYCAERTGAEKCFRRTGKETEMNEKMCIVQTYIADITELLQEDNYRKIYEMVPQFRKEKADRLRHRPDQAQSIGAWYLWMKVQEELGIAPDEIAAESLEVLRQSPAQKNDVPEKERRSRDKAVWNMNLSHSGRYVLCSVAPNGARVGCDIETVKSFRKGLAKRFFCPEEYDLLMAQDERERTEMFYRYWVLKESFVKAVRRGLGMGLASFSICLEAGKDPILAQKPKDIKEQYYMKEYKVEGARAAVCSTGPELADSLIILDINKGMTGTNMPFKLQENYGKIKTESERDNIFSK